MALIDIIVPAEQEGTKAVVKSWLKHIGEPVRVHDPLVELETDKVVVEVAATIDGVLDEILLDAGSEVEPGMVLGRITDATSSSVEEAPREARGVVVSPPCEQHGTSNTERLSPGMRRMLAEHGLHAREVPSSGERLTREDIQAEIDRRAKGATSVPAPGVTRVPHDTMRKRIAEHMAHSLQTVPHVTALFEADFSAIIAHRTASKAAFERDGTTLTFTAYLVAASAMAMKAAPAVNGRWFEDRIEIYDDVNVGIGTALGEKGLIVPVIHRAQSLSLIDIARRLTELTGKARSGKLAPADVRDGTFSISNHGVSGSLLAAPIVIDEPQAAILGIGKLQKRVVVRESGGADAIEIRPMAYVTLTIDHRVIDAYQTNAWHTRFVRILETWPLSA